MSPEEARGGRLWQARLVIPSRLPADFGDRLPINAQTDQLATGAYERTDEYPDSKKDAGPPSPLLNEYQRQAKELAAEKAGRLTAESRLAARETEMATMKLLMAKLARAQFQQLQFASAP